MQNETIIAKEWLHWAMWHATKAESRKQKAENWAKSKTYGTL